jgi:cytoskeletal protein CcmA (bactofilin family)
MTGFATFAYSKKYFVSQEIEFISESEIDPEFGESYKAPQDLIRLLADNVGIGTTNITTARQELDVYGTAIVSGRVGIATTQPREELDVIGTVIISDSVGIGTTNPTGKLQVGVASSIFIVTGIGSVGIGSTRPEQRLDISGSVKIDANIFDSANSPGVNGAFLNRDANGIRWVTFTPNFSEGIFIQDDGTYIPVVGAAQSFTVLNFKEINSLGIGTTTITPIPNPDNPTLIADIRTQDLWGYTVGGDIYRMTKVGIQNNNPSTTLDITGTLHATQDVTFDSTLDVDGDTTLNSTLDVDGATTLNSTLDVDGDTTLNSTLDVDGATTLNSTLDVDGDTTLNSTLDVDGDTTLNSTLDVDGATTLNSTLDVDGATHLTNTSSWNCWHSHYNHRNWFCWYWNQPSIYRIRYCKRCTITKSIIRLKSKCRI